VSDRSTLTTLLESLGTMIVEVLAAPVGMEIAIAHPVIDDPNEPPPIDAGDLVLAVGTALGSPGAGDLITRAGRAGAAAVIFRTSESPPPSVISAAEASSVALLRVVPPMVWSQLHTLLRTAVAASGSSSPESESAGAIGDLFSLANAIATMVGGPTTIEDPQSTVLAYSSLDEPIDEARRQTILGRRVPEDWLRRLHDDGIFRRLWSGEGVVHVEYPGVEPKLRPRIAIAVRAGGEVLGSIWVAQEARPFDSGAEAALVEAARIAALHLIRARSSEDVERARRSSLLRAMLDGQAVAEALAESLDTRADCYVKVVAFRLPSASVTELAVQARRACRLLDLYCESTRRKGSAVATGPLVYLLLVDEARPVAERVDALAREMVGERGELLPVGTMAGIGSTLVGLANVPESRSEADRALAVLSSGLVGESTPTGSAGSDLASGLVASIDDVRSHAILLRLRDMARTEPGLLKGRLETLIANDQMGRVDYVETLKAFLDASGDVTAAARAVGVHPNSFRYRLRRLTEISGLDLGDPAERLIAHLQIYMSS